MKNMEKQPEHAENMEKSPERPLQKKRRFDPAASSSSDYPDNFGSHSPKEGQYDCDQSRSAMLLASERHSESSMQAEQKDIIVEIDKKIAIKAFIIISKLHKADLIPQERNNIKELAIFVASSRESTIQKFEEHETDLRNHIGAIKEKIEKEGSGQQRSDQLDHLEDEQWMADLRMSVCRQKKGLLREVQWAIAGGQSKSFQELAALRQEFQVLTKADQALDNWSYCRKQEKELCKRQGEIKQAKQDLSHREDLLSTAEFCTLSNKLSQEKNIIRDKKWIVEKKKHVYEQEYRLYREEQACLDPSLTEEENPPQKLETLRKRIQILTKANQALKNCSDCQKQTKELYKRENEIEQAKGDLDHRRDLLPPEEFRELHKNLHREENIIRDDKEVIDSKMYVCKQVYHFYQEGQACLDPSLTEEKNRPRKLAALREKFQVLTRASQALKNCSDCQKQKKELCKREDEIKQAMQDLSHRRDLLPPEEFRELEDSLLQEQNSIKNKQQVCDKNKHVSIQKYRNIRQQIRQDPSWVEVE